MRAGVYLVGEVDPISGRLHPKPSQIGAITGGNQDGGCEFNAMTDPKGFCSVLRRAEEKLPFLLLALLSRNGRLVSTGRANLDHERSCGAFRAIDGSVLDAASTGLCLKVVETGNVVAIQDFHPCPEGAADYHFSIEG